MFVLEGGRGEKSKSEAASTPDVALCDGNESFASHFQWDLLLRCSWEQLSVHHFTRVA